MEGSISSVETDSKKSFLGSLKPSESPTFKKLGEFVHFSLSPNKGHNGSPRKGWLKAGWLRGQGNLPIDPMGSIEKTSTVDIALLSEKLADLGITGAPGLLQIAREDLSVKDLVDSRIALCTAVKGAKGHFENCEMLDNFCGKVMKFLAAVDYSSLSSPEGSVSLARLRVGMKESVSIASACSGAGWLYRMACDENIGDVFARISTEMVSAAKALTIVDVSTAAVLLAELEVPPYTDVHKKLRKMLKQMGGGSILEGIKDLKINDRRRTIVGELIKASPSQILADTTVSSDALNQHMPDSQGIFSSASEIEFRSMFSLYTAEGCEMIDSRGFETVLQDLGKLDFMSSDQAAIVARQQFVVADAKKDGFVDFQEFVEYYKSQPVYHARNQTRRAVGLTGERMLLEVFSRFVTFGVGRSANEREGLDSQRFAKLCKDCGLLDSNLKASHLDAVFCAKKQRDRVRMSFEQLLASFLVIAEKKGQSLESVLKCVMEADGPVCDATKVSRVRLYDDRELWSGTIVSGGPSTGPTVVDAASLVSRATPRRKSIQPEEFALDLGVVRSPSRCNSSRNTPRPLISAHNLTPTSARSTRPLGLPTPRPSRASASPEKQTVYAEASNVSDLSSYLSSHLPRRVEEEAEEVSSHDARSVKAESL